MLVICSFGIKKCSFFVFVNGFYIICHFLFIYRVFSLQISQHTALDCGFIELLPDLYTHHESEALVNVRCNGNLKWEPCSGASNIVFKVTGTNTVVFLPICKSKQRKLFNLIRLFTVY